MTLKDKIGFVLSLVLSGLGKIPRVPDWLGQLLIFTGIALAIFFLFHGLIDAIRQKMPKRLTDAKSALAEAENIYELAADKGGILLATHIFPRDAKFENDLAIKILKEVSPTKELTFKRVLIVRNRDLEAKWVEELFGQLSPKIDKTIYVLARYPDRLPRFVEAVVPRINLLLYEGPEDYRALIGLDHLVQHENEQRANFALLFRHQQIYSLLAKYFDRITHYGEMIHLSTLESYRARPNLAPFPVGIQEMLNSLVTYAENCPGMVHAGTFGSVAKIALGLLPQVKIQDHEADLDLLLVYSEESGLTSEKIKEEISVMWDGKQVRIIWGDDEMDFYSWRVRGKINLDIEIKPIGSVFFDNNPLLGTSIFACYMPLYASEGKSLGELLRLPQSTIPTQRRWSLLIDDRKGLLDFQKRLATSSAEKTDPRRVTSLVVRNVTWALSGCHPHSSHAACSFLAPYWPEVSARVSQKAVKDILACSNQDGYQHREEHFRLCSLLVDDALQFAQRQLARA